MKTAVVTITMDCNV